MPLVDTSNSRTFMAKASMDKEIADLYTRRDKVRTAFMKKKKIFGLIQKKSNP